MNINVNTHNQLSRLLTASESILWTGCPEKGKLFHRQDIFMIPFSIVWFSFVIFWELSAIRSGQFFFILWGVPFILVGFYLVFGRFFHQQFLKNRSYYALTTERILRVRGRRTDFLVLSRIQTMHQHKNRDGSGSIYFNSEPRTVRPYYTRVRGFSSKPAQPEPFCLEDIAGVEQVSRMIAEQMEELTGRR